MADRNPTSLLIWCRQLGGARRLNDNQVFEYLERDHGAAFGERIQSPSTDLGRRNGPITPDKDGLVHDVGGYMQLQGYEELGRRALHGLLVLQTRSGKVQPDDVQDRDEKFACGTHFIRAVSAPGTGKTTALRNIWGYVHDSFLKLVALLPLAPDDSRLVQLHERVKNCLSPKCFLSFTFSNEGLLELLPEEAKASTGDFMATRMLFAMVRPQIVTHRIFLQRMDPHLRLTLATNHLVDFIHQKTGLGDRPGLVAFNFDECGAPRLKPFGNTTYFLEGLSSLVALRWSEAQQRFAAGNRARNILPVVFIAGSCSAHMNLLNTGSGRARIFTLGRPLLDDESLLVMATDFLARVAAGSGREVPETAEAVLKLAIPWLGYNPRHLVWLLQFASSNPYNPYVSHQPPLHVGCLWHFLSLPRSALEDNVFAVLGKVEEKIRSSNWKLWLSRVGEERKAALFMRSFAHTVTARPIARSAEIPGTGITWGDAENDASSCSQDGQTADQRQGQMLQPQLKSELSDEDMEEGGLNMDEGDGAPDADPTAYVHIPPLLLRVMYQQLSVTRTRVRSLQQFTESWGDREQSDLGLLLLRLQLVRVVFGEETLDLEQLCPGLGFLGEVHVPATGYDIQRMDQQLNAASFQRQCLQQASRDSCWAYLGPGNWGPAWLILFSPAGDTVVIYVQSKSRSTIAAMYPRDALPAGCLKCWRVSNVQSCLLFLTDERGRGHDNEALDVEGGMHVVPVSWPTTFGIAVATLKRCRETVIVKEAGHKKAKKRARLT